MLKSKQCGEKTGGNQQAQGGGKTKYEKRGKQKFKCHNEPNEVAGRELTIKKRKALGMTLLSNGLVLKAQKKEKTTE